MKISSLIVTYNRLEKLQKTVEATLALPFQHIVIINNASTDNTSQWLSSLTDSRVVVLTLSENMGGAYGFKHGAEWICENSNCDWVVFYDDDAYPSSDFIDCFELNRMDGCYTYACNVIDERGEICKMNIPWKSYPTGIIGQLEYLFHKNKFIPDFGRNEKIVSVSFVGLIISRELLKKHTQHIHEELFIYFDDVYFSHHLTLAGEKIYMLPSVKVVHAVNANASVEQPWKIYFLIRNLLLSSSIFKKETPFGVMAKLLRIFKYITTGMRVTGRKKYFKYLSLGIYHGITGKSGKQIDW